MSDQKNKKPEGVAPLTSVEDEPIIDMLTFKVAFKRKHIGMPRYDILLDALKEYVEDVNGQRAMDALKDYEIEEPGHTGYPQVQLNTYNGPDNAFESNGGLLVWWDHGEERKGSYIVIEHRYGGRCVTHHAENFQDACEMRIELLKKKNGPVSVTIAEECPVVYKDGRYHK